MRRVAVIIGTVCCILGVLIAGIGAAGPLFVQPKLVRSAYGDPRTPHLLPPGDYPVDWYGPAKESFPSDSAQDLRAEVTSGDAEWIEPRMEEVIPILGAGSDLARQPFGTIRVHRVSTVTVAFPHSDHLASKPRIRLSNRNDDTVDRRATNLIFIGVAVTAIGAIAVAWGRPRPFRRGPVPAGPF